MGLIIDEIFSDPRLTVLIDIPSVGVVRSVIIEDFQLSGEAEYSAPFDAMGGSELFGMIMEGVRRTAAEFGAEKFANMRVKSLDQTVSTWQNSGKPTFSVPMIFVSTGRRSAAAEAKKLLAAVYPLQASGSTIIPPHNYTTSWGSDNVSSAITLQIGTWFRASKLVCRNVETTYSKELTANGRPLYARAVATLESALLVDARTVTGWVKA